MEIKLEKIEKVTVYELNEEHRTITFQTGDILEVKTKSKVYKGKFLGVYNSTEYMKEEYVDRLRINLDCSTDYHSDIELVTLLGYDIVSIRVINKEVKK